MTNPAPHGTAGQHQQRQQDEWNQYTAIVPIDFYGMRAYNPGDPVPVSAVEGDVAWIPSDYVSRGAAFEGSATVPPAEPPPIDPTSVAAPAVSSPVDPNADGSNTASTED